MYCRGIKTYLPRDTREQSWIRFRGDSMGRPGCQPISSAVSPGPGPCAPGHGVLLLLPIVVFPPETYTYIFTLPFSFQFISFIYAIFYVLIHFFPVLVVVAPVCSINLLSLLRAPGFLAWLLFRVPSHRSGRSVSHFGPVICHPSRFHCQFRGYTSIHLLYIFVYIMYNRWR